MKKNAITVLAFCGFTLMASGQNIGIGITNPQRSKLETNGVAGSGSTSGIFGDALGISVQRNLPAIGFNQYRDNADLATNGRYMNDGFAAVMSFVHNDPTLSQGFTLNLFPKGTAGNLLPAGLKAWTITANGRHMLQAPGGGPWLDVGRGTGEWGTAAFAGSTYWSHFNFGPTEDTYIRPGKSNQKVYINDIVGGSVIMGDGAARVGVNYNNPVYTFEIREVNNTGVKIRPPTGAYTWEWRVSGSPANFNLYYNGALKNYLRTTDGALNLLSDERLKKNIQPLQPILDKLMQLQPVSYEMRADNPNHIRSMGFVAQQVAPLFPELVSSEDGSENSKLLMNYTGFVVLAIKGIQEEQKNIEQLEMKIIQGEALMNRVEAKLKQLRNRVANDNVTASR